MSAFSYPPTPAGHRQYLRDHEYSSACIHSYPEWLAAWRRAEKAEADALRRREA